MAPTSRTISVVNEKGGVGKTTTTVHLARAMALQGATVVVVDMDGQATATKYMLGHEDGRPPEIDRSVYDLLMDPDLDGLDVLQMSDRFQCGVIPSSVDLKTWFLDTIFPENPEGGPRDLLRPVLSHRLDATSESFREAVEASIDFFLIDAPPSFGSLYLQALMASDDLLIPVTLETLSIEGIYTFTETLEQLNVHIDYEPDILGILPCMVDGRRRTQTPKKLSELREAFGPVVTPDDTHVPINSELAQAQSSLPGPSNNALHAYRNLGQWVRESTN